MPDVGDIVLQAETEQRARKALDFRRSKDQSTELEGANKVRREQTRAARRLRKGVASEVRATQNHRARAQKEIRARMADNANQALELGIPELAIILKTDVVGSEEAIVQMLAGLNLKEVVLTISKTGVGEVVDSDLDSAEMLGAQIMCFNLPQNRAIQSKAEQRGIEVTHHNVIYELMDVVESRLLDLMPKEEVVVGRAEVRKIFNITGTKKATIAGSHVMSGTVYLDQPVRLIRAGAKIFDGNIKVLKRVKDAVTSVESGADCGVELADCKADVEEGDVLECYELRRPTSIGY